LKIGTDLLLIMTNTDGLERLWTLKISRAVLVNCSRF